MYLKRKELLIDEFHLTTLHIFYFMPDYQSILQEFLWQFSDIPPIFPKANDFLSFWKENIEGPIHKVELVHSDQVYVGEYSYSDFKFMIRGLK